MEVLDEKGAKLILAKLEKYGGELSKIQFPVRTTWRVNSCTDVKLSDTAMVAPILKKAFIGKGALNNCTIEGTSIDGIGAYKINFLSLKITSSTISKIYDGYFEKCAFKSGCIEYSNIRSSVFKSCKFEDFLFKENDSSKIIFDNCLFERVSFLGTLNTVNFNDACVFNEVDFSSCRMSEVLFGKSIFHKTMFPSESNNFAIFNRALFEIVDELRTALPARDVKAYDELLSYYPRTGLTVVDSELFHGIKGRELELVFSILKERQINNPVTLTVREMPTL